MKLKLKYNIQCEIKTLKRMVKYFNGFIRLLENLALLNVQKI